MYDQIANAPFDVRLGLLVAFAATLLILGFRIIFGGEAENPQ